MSIRDLDVRIQPSVNLAPVIELNRYMNDTVRAFQQTDNATREWRDSMNRMNQQMNQTGRQTNQTNRAFGQSNQQMQQMAQHTNRATQEMRQMSNQMNSTYRSTQRMIDESQALNNQLGRQSDVIRALASTAGTSATQLAHDWQAMSNEMRRSMINNHNDMLKYRQQLMKTEHDMYKLGSQMGNYTGSTNDFMNEIRRLGKEHKKSTDQMINNNVAMRQSIIQQVATMSAMSGQSEKIAKNYDRMGNSLLKVNNPLLSVTSNLSRLARESSAASLALQMLGPNASMKELQDMIGMITQGVMRMQSVAMVTSVAWAGFTAILANAAKGPDVGENLAAQAKAWADYRDALQTRTQEIIDTWGLFEKVQLEKTSPQKLLSNLQGQVKVMQDWSKNLNSLASKGVDEGFIASLRKMGPEAASQIAALNQMSQPQLNKYVDLWRQKHQLARQAATTELEKLKQETQLKVKGLQDSLTPLGVSLYNFKNTWASAVAPFVAFWGTIAAKIVDVGTMIGGFINKLNEINPWITKLAGMFLYLVATFALILTPLAAGIGYIMGLKAAFAAAWVFIGPLVEGLAAMMGTVVLVSAAVIAFGAALYLLWTRSETFRNAVISGWTAIKNKALEVWGFLSPYINQAMSAVTTFVHAKLVQLQAFWDNNGQQILQATRNVFGFISSIIQGALTVIGAIFRAVFPVLVILVKSVWGNIQGIISGALNVIMGLVKVFSGLFTGDFRKMWEGLKQIFFGAIQVVWNYVNLMMFGRILSAGKLFFSGFRSVFVSLWQGLVSLFKASVTNVKNTVQYGFTAMKLLGQNIMTGLKNAVIGIWTSLYGGVKGMLGRIGSSIKSAWTTARSETKQLFGMIRDDVANTFGKIVQGAKDLPGKIGSGIKGMAGKVTGGIEALTSKVFGGFKKMINGATGGLNWIMKKIGADFYIDPWVPKYATGTGYHPGGPAILGDGGMKELYVTPSGAMGMSPATDTLLNLPQGTKVFSGPQTQQLMQSGMIPAYDKGNLGSSFKSVASDLWEGTKNVAGAAKDKAVGAGKAVKDTAVAGANKVKDLSLDVWSYVSEPSKLLKKVFASFVPKPPAISEVFNKVFPASLTKIKDNALGFVKKKMEEFSFLGGDASGTGIGSYYLGSPFRITTNFTPNGNKNDRVHKGGVHHGLDLAAPQGTPIKSLTDGIVKQVLIGSSTAGNGVRIQSGSDLLSYIHMMSAPFVKQGQHVKEGQVIGRVGSTGEELPLLTVMVSRIIL
ncbi:peptidoglycan DD-metalloendopeptidase family protein [Priestia megaterium]|uniref:peptidoglycan DD-metalloendopeptidase family protein n=1 Tax=Priestia megaterium TaxID=1404 RepID=UPI00067FC1FE|nr:peptidoglycan DD-metalloendopeptidase family protein [Priestia megaterium]